VAGKQLVVIAFKAFAAVTPEAIVPGTAVQRVAAEAAVEPVSGRAAIKEVITGAAVEYPHEIAAAAHQIGQIERVLTLDEFQIVITAQACHPELFDQGMSI